MKRLLSAALVAGVLVMPATAMPQLLPGQTPSSPPVGSVSKEDVALVQKHIQCDCGKYDIDSYAAAIRRIETGGTLWPNGRYDIKVKAGKRNGKTRWALGAYQIMEENLPSWSREALGREVSTEEFLKSPAIQDAIFKYWFKKYADKWGPENAARAWLAGPGYVKKHLEGKAKSQPADIFGTTPDVYAERFLKALFRLFGAMG
jgi:hypothetical protein